MRARDIEVGVSYHAHGRPEPDFVATKIEKIGEGNMRITYEWNGEVITETSHANKDWILQTIWEHAGGPYVIQELVLG